MAKVKRKKSSAAGKSNIEQYQKLVAVYDIVTALERPFRELTTAELERLSADMYNVIYPSLHPKRKILLNELIDLEVELKSRIKLQQQ
jgi:hypothetical protein